MRKTGKIELSNNIKRNQSGGEYGKRIFRGLEAALILLTFLFLASCADSASERAAKVGGLTAAQVIENPAAYVGKTVTVSGDVEEIHGPRAFNMDSGASVGELLVVGREPFPNLPDAGSRGYLVNDVATVTGVVRMLVVGDVEREIGWTLDPGVVTKFNSKPVLIAQSISFKPGKNTAANTMNPGVNQSAATTNSGQTATGGNQMMNGSNQTMMNNNAGNQTMAGDKLTDAGVYASAADKSTLIGKQGQFSNLKVVRVVGPRTFTVAAGKDEIYVMLDDESARGVGTQGKIDPGKTLDLSGRFERLQADEVSDIANNRFRALTDTERAFLKKTPIYFRADQVSNLK